MKTRVRRGFTLPEVLVTVTVVAVLAAVVVPAVTQYVSKGDTPATQQDLNEIRNAITAYMADTRSAPTTLYDLVAPANNKGPYLAAPLTGATATGTFTSGGLGFTLGPTITNAGDGYLVADVALKGGNSVATCGDLYALDNKLDQSTNSATATAGTDAAAGLLVWDNSGCATTTTTISTANALPKLRVASVGK